MYPFVHLLDHGVVVCVECQHAVLPSNINTNLSDVNKHNSTKEKRQQVIQEVENIEGLIIKRADLDRLVFPPASEPPISALQDPRTDGLKCRLRDEYQEPCRFISCHQNQN
jgi:hypothetical protein